MSNAGKADTPVIKRRTILTMAAATFMPIGTGVLSAWAQEPAFPSKPVRIVVPFAAGGPTDVTARVIGERLAARWGQNVIIENRPGAGGNLGSDQVARSAPDGTVLVLGVTGSHAINTTLMKQMPYHPLTDFEPVTQAALFPNAIVVHPGLGISTLAELFALVKREPGRHTFGHDGVGTASHLTMEVIKSRAGLDMPAVAYRGGGPLSNDLIAGHVRIGITGLPTLQPHIASGAMRLIAVSTAERVPSNPDAPTLKEQGMDLVAAPWSGFFAPKGTPAPIVNKIAADVASILAEPAVRDSMRAIGNTPAPSSPAAFRQFVEEEIKTWADAVRLSGAKVE